MSSVSQKRYERDVFFDSVFEADYRRSPLLVVDAGARGGLKQNWAPARRHLRVVGFEPDPLEFARLSQNGTGGDGHTYFGVALHDRRGPIRLNVARDRGLTSIFEPNREFLASFPDADRFDTIDVKEVQAETLDHIVAEHGLPEVDFIKADTQGSELHVLKGAAGALASSVVGLEVEAEFAPIYAGQPLFADVDAFLRPLGFLLFDLRPCYWKRAAGPMAGGPQGEIIWADALYLRSAASLRAVVAGRPVPGQRAKVLHLLSVALLYGYVDYALEIAQVGAGVFSAEEQAAIARQLNGQIDARRRLPAFPGRRPLAAALRRLWTLVREPNDGWSVSGADLGNLD